jgi:hypothetical protein
VRPRRQWPALLCGPSTSSLEGERLAQLLYETTDPDFADRAITAMRESNIPCYRVGHGYTDPGVHPYGLPTESQICIYIERDADYAEANRILIGLGAIVDAPLPTKWIVAFLLTAAIIAIWFAVQFTSQ